MNITVNGETVELPDNDVSVSRLLELREVKMPDMVSVELNGEIVDRGAFDCTIIEKDDKVEFLYFMGGGSSNIS